MLRVSCEPFLLQATSVLLILLSYLSETAYGSVHHSTETVHVVLIIDKQSVKSAFTAIHSVSLASTDASRLRFHALVLPSDGFDAKSVLDAAPQCMQRSVNFEVKGWMAPSIYPKFAVSGKGFDNEHIYARFFIPDIFPEIDRYVYIDNDVIVNGDIIDLYSIQLDEILSVMHRREMEAQLMKERANALSRSLDRSRREPDDKGNLPSIQRAVVGFVVEKSYFYKNYVSAHFNLEHPVVKKAMRLLNKPFLFFNAGVSVVDAILWRERNLTMKAVDIIISNYNASASSGKRRWTMYNPETLGDQGTYFLLLLLTSSGASSGYPISSFGIIPTRWNMRRTPVNYLPHFNNGETGIFHFAGMTYGDTDHLCSNAMLHPFTFRSALPFFLSVVTSHRLSHPSCGTRTASKSIFVHNHAKCEHATRLIVDFNVHNGSIVSFNPGRTKLAFP